MSLNSILLSLYVRGREHTNKILGPIRRYFVEDKHFTIISNNCWGGHVYRYVSISYSSPTIGLYFYADDYIKFVKDLKNYIALSKGMKFIKPEESKYIDDIVATGRKRCPIGVIGDVEIFFLHYKTEEEAYKKWNRRCERINFDNIIYKFSEQNLCSLSNLKEFDELPFETKFMFTRKDYGLKHQVVFKEFEDEKEVSNDTALFRKYIKLIKFINHKPFDEFVKNQ